MELTSTLPILLSFLVSYAIAVLAGRKRSSRVEDHLYRGNRPRLAIASELGSLFSLSVSCTALVSGGYIYGWRIVIPLALGIGVSLLILRMAVNSKSLRRFLIQNRRNNMASGASLFVFLGAKRGRHLTIALAICGLLFYALLLTTEFLLARMLLERFAGATGASLVLFLLLLAATCFIYVYVGGFRGVLYTDHFQFILILIFCGALLGITNLRAVINSIPPIATSLLPDTLTTSAVLYLSIFLGTIMVLTGMPDHWVRLVGTLQPREVESTLSWSLVIFGVGASGPILIGSRMHNSTIVPSGVTNEASLYLLDTFFSSASPGMLFIGYMILACVLLTTIDTYTITTQQIYYEFAIRIHATTHRNYILEWLLKWKEVRIVSLFPLLFALVVTLVLPGLNVYVLGVFALAGPSFWAPTLILELLAQKNNYINELVTARSQIQSLVLGLLISPAVMWLLSIKFGTLSDHLYLIFGGAALSGIGAHFVVLLIKQGFRTLQSDSSPTTKGRS